MKFCPKQFVPSKAIHRFPTQIECLIISQLFKPRSNGGFSLIKIFQSFENRNFFLQIVSTVTHMIIFFSM